MISVNINELTENEREKISDFYDQLDMLPEYSTLQEIYLGFKIQKNRKSKNIKENTNNNEQIKQKKDENLIKENNKLKLDSVKSNLNNINTEEIFDEEVNGVTKIKKAEIYKDKILKDENNGNNHKFSQLLNRKHGHANIIKK